MYEPMSREQLLANGKCCFTGKVRCYHCPYYQRPEARPITVDTRIAQALRSGKHVTLYIDRYSLVPEVVLQGRVILRYKTLPSSGG